ncbi:MAG: hypothetical protein PHC53_04640 [Patescibacteria group bacterium]|nr:hypothetical protein [Patescibacteria group bacterium]
MRLGALLFLHNFLIFCLGGLTIRPFHGKEKTDSDERQTSYKSGVARRKIMRTFILTVTMLFALWLVGCTSYTRVRNGIPEYHAQCGIGGYVCGVEINDAKYPRAVAELGPMPGGMEVGLATQRVVTEETRRNISTLYGGMMMPWGYGNYGVMTGLRGAGYYNVMPPMPTSLPLPYGY